MASIFEEHHLCHNSRQLSSEQFCSAEGIYVLDENKFIFNKVLVGQTAQARFKLTNNNKVPCVLSLAIKYGGTKVRPVKLCGVDTWINMYIMWLLLIVLQWVKKCPVFPHSRPGPWRFLICLLQQWAFPASHTRLLWSPSHHKQCSYTVLCLRPRWRNPAGIWVHDCFCYFGVIFAVCLSFNFYYHYENDANPCLVLLTTVLLFFPLLDPEWHPPIRQGC